MPATIIVTFWALQNAESVHEDSTSFTARAVILTLNACQAIFIALHTLADTVHFGVSHSAFEYTGFVGQVIATVTGSTAGRGDLTGKTLC